MTRETNMLRTMYFDRSENVNVPKRKTPYTSFSKRERPRALRSPKARESKKALIDRFHCHAIKKINRKLSSGKS